MEETEDVYDNTYADFIGDNTRIVGGSTVSRPFMLDEYIDHGKKNSSIRMYFKFKIIS